MYTTLFQQVTYFKTMSTILDVFWLQESGIDEAYFKENFGITFARFHSFYKIVVVWEGPKFNIEYDTIEKAEALISGLTGRKKEDWHLMANSK